MKKSFIILLLLMIIMISCSKEERNTFVDDGSRYSVSNTEISPANDVTYYLWEENSNSSIITYYCFYYLPILNTPAGFKGAWDNNKKKTVSQESFDYSLDNSILTIEYSSNVEVFKMEKAKNRPIQDGDRIFLNNRQYRVQIETLSK